MKFAAALACEFVALGLAWRLLQRHRTEEPRRVQTIAIWAVVATQPLLITQVYLDSWLVVMAMGTIVILCAVANIESDT